MPIRRILADGLKPETSKEKKKLHLAGAHNIFFMIVIVAAVILSGVLPQKVPFFAKGIHFYGEVELGYASILEMAMILSGRFPFPPHNEEGSPRRESFHMGCDPGGCRTFHRYLHYDDPGTSDPEGERRRSWYQWSLGSSSG